MDEIYYWLMYRNSCGQHEDSNECKEGWIRRKEPDFCSMVWIDMGLKVEKLKSFQICRKQINYQYNNIHFRMKFNFKEGEKKLWVFQNLQFFRERNLNQQLKWTVVENVFRKKSL